MNPGLDEQLHDARNLREVHAIDLCIRADGDPRAAKMTDGLHRRVEAARHSSQMIVRSAQTVDRYAHALNARLLGGPRAFFGDSASARRHGACHSAASD